MNIEFVNHASFIAEHDGVRLICDPWIEGTAFFNGWSLITKSEFNPEGYKNITHIWFSHEHPDHFSPPNLNKIKPEYRKQITVLYQETNDKKIVNWCVKQGFKQIVELKKNEYFRLADDFEVMNSKFLWDDSWMFIKTKETTILNVNDCVITTEHDARTILNAFNDKVDILFTQFSYAGYHGNKDEPEERKKAASEKLREIELQVSVFKPRMVIPFASYVWFSHEENYFMNDGINKIDKIYDYIQSLHVTPLVLYPGEKWQVGTEHNSPESVKKYMRDYEAILAQPQLAKSITVSLEEIMKNAAELSRKVLAKYGRAYFRLKLRKLKPLLIYVTDLNTCVRFTFLDGMKKVPGSKYDVSMSSEVLNFSMKNDYGFNTTCINARFQKSSNDGFDKMVFYTGIANAINHDHAFTKPQYLKIAINKLLRTIGLRSKTSAT